MRGEMLLAAMEAVDPALVEDARAPRRRGGRTGRLAVLMAAAVLILALGTTAAARYGDWFMNYFAEKSGGELSASQQAAIKALTAVVDQSRTVDGWTVTVDRALATRHNAYIKLDVTAPAGTALNPERQNYDCDVEISGFNTEDTSDEGVTGYGLKMQLFREEGMAENESAILLELDRTAAAASALDLADGRERTVTVKDLRVWQLDEQSRLTEELLAEGTWRFTFALPRAEEIELADGTVSVLAEDPVTGNREDVGISSFRLTALGATCEYVTACDYIQPFDGVTVTMTDGTKVTGEEKENSARDFGKVCSFTFDAPIDLDAVDYVMFQGAILPMPER